jgi:dipeptidyl aminopeptidase/acylaminoacyl peptidase
MNRTYSSIILAFSLILLAASSPDTREITDPKTIQSESNASAAPIPIDDLFFTRSVGGASWSPDGKQVLFISNLTGRVNLWKVKSTGGWPIQLSQSDDRETDPTWSRDGQWIVYQSDKGGGEIYDLYAIPSDGGEAINLTNTPDISETSPVFSPDGTQVSISYKPKTAPVYDRAIMDWKSRAVRNLTQEKSLDHLWQGAIWSPDGKAIYSNRVNAGFTDSDIYRVDVASGAKENLTPHQGQVRYGASVVSRDGRNLLISSNEKGGNTNVALLDIATKKLTFITDAKWDAEPNDFSPDGKWFTYTVNEDGRTDAYLGETSTHRGQKLNLPPGINSFEGRPNVFTADGKRLLISHEGSRQPSDLWVYDIANRSATQLTFSSIASLRPSSIPQSQLVHYKSFDGKIISAFMWVPFNLKRDGSNPAIVLPHGGPTGQTVDSFARTEAALASRGYICIAPNVRGSTGYGLDFQRANTKDLGGGDLQDEVFAAKFLTATGYVDEKKIGITGGSYGGYMTLMAIGKTPDVWAAAVEEYGIINWLTMLEHEDPFLQQYEKSLLGDPVADRKVYDDASPIKFIRDTKAPLLVLQGDNDIRVPKEEAEQVVSILKESGKTVDAHFYPNEGHGFAKRENQVDAIRRTVAWFDHYLKNKEN